MDNQILTPEDLAVFMRFGIGPDVLHDAGIRRVTDQEAREYLTTQHRGDLAGLLFPYLDPVTRQRVTCRIRRDHPEVDGAGKPQGKYLASYGDSPHLFFSPSAGALLADTAVPVVLVEAEKSALALDAMSRRVGRPLVALALGGCWSWRTQRAGKGADAAGARVSIAGPQPDLSRITWQGRDVVIMFDSNAATNPRVRQARRQLADELAGRGARVRIGTVPAEPGVNGPDDFRAAHDDASMLALIDDAVLVQPATVDELLSDCGVLSLPNPVRASQVEPVLRLVRDALRGADTLRVSAVRSELVPLLKARGVTDAARLVDSAITKAADPVPDLPFLSDPEPWPDTVDGAAVLEAVVALFTRYMVLPPHAADALALWVLHAYVMGAWGTSPILAVLSPLKRCGKSILMELIAALAPRSLLVSNLSTSSLFRAMEAFRPTLLSDEADTWLSDDTSELRGVFNSGWRRGTAHAMRCDGDEHEPRLFSTWGAKAIAAIGKLPDTIADRSITVHLRRKTKAETVAKFRHSRVEAEATTIRRQLLRWASDHEAECAGTEPDELDALNDRASDNWHPLRVLSIAVGRDWPARTDAAALALSGIEADADDNIGVQLLADIKTAFNDRDEDALASSLLIAVLGEMGERPWAEWSHGKPINGHKLARLLRPFGIVPANARVDGKVCKAYRRGAFTEAWERYLPSEPGFKALHRNKLNESGPESPLSEPLQGGLCSALKSEDTSMNTGRCYAVALSIPATGAATPYEDL